MPDLLSPQAFMTGNAPNAPNYAAPLIGMQLGDRLADLPNQYYQGQQRARSTALQNAFPNGLPQQKDANGNLILDQNGRPQIDIAGMTNTLTKLGGAEYAGQMLPLLMEGQMGAAGAAAIQGNAAAAPTSSPAPANSNAAGPGHILGPRGTSAQGGAQANVPGQPQLSTAGADNQGQDTVRSVATEAFGGRDVSAIIPRFAAALGVSPDAPLSPQQVQQARALMTRTAQATPSNVSAMTGGGAPVTPLSGASGAGAPPPGNAPETASPATGIVPSVPPSTPQPQQTQQVPGVPPGYDPGGYANALLKYAQGLHAKAAQYSAFKGGQAMSQSLENQAKATEDRAKQIFDYMGTAAQPTAEQKNLASGATQRTGELENEIKQSQKTYDGMQAQSEDYEQHLKPYLDITRGMLSDPKMFTGTGANLSLDWNRVRSIYGDPQAAALQEGFQKITASSVLAQLNAQKFQLMEAGGTAGRIFAQQVDLVNKAAPQLGNTLAGNRMLVEVQSRAGEISSQVTQQARDYIAANGHLDAKFDTQIANWMKQHPLFTKQEITNPALLGAPSAPPALNNTPDRIAWGNGIGLRKGDPFRVNGKYQYWQGASAAPNAGSAVAAPANRIQGAFSEFP